MTNSKKDDTTTDEVTAEVLPVLLTKTSIQDASTAEIREFSASTAGLDFPDDVGRTFMIREIYDALGWEMYAPDKDATHVRVTLPVIKGGQNMPYSGGFNGTSFTIKRGVEVEISIGQYNTIIDSASMKFTIDPLNPEATNMIEGGSATRIPYGALDVEVVEFINKGKK